MRAESGGEGALKIMEEYGRHLGETIKMIMLILSPEAIFLGGYVSKSFRYFQTKMYESVNDFPFKKVLDKIVIQKSEMDNIAVLGAASQIITGKNKN